MTYDLMLGHVVIQVNTPGGLYMQISPIFRIMHFHKDTL
jgi:membrane-bound ClpP family serine protease